MWMDDIATLHDRRRKARPIQGRGVRPKGTGDGFSLEGFRDQLCQIKKPGSMESLINGRPPKRTATGSGTTVQDVNSLLRQHTQMSNSSKAWAAA